MPRYATNVGINLSNQCTFAGYSKRVREYAGNAHNHVLLQAPQVLAVAAGERIELLTKPGLK